MGETIQDRNSARMATQKTRLKQEHDARMNALEVEYQDQRGPVAQKEKVDRRAAEFNSHMLDLSQIDEEAAEELRLEISSYQRRLQMTKDAEKGTLDRKELRNGLQEYESRVLPLQNQLTKMEEARQEKIGKVDASLGFEEWQRQIAEIEEEYKKKRTAIESMIEDIKSNFIGVTIG